MKLLVLRETNVYNDCTMKSHIIGKVPKGYISDYIEYLNGWYRVRENVWVYNKDGLFPDSEVIVKDVKNAKDQGEIKFDTKKIKELGFDLQLFAIIPNIDSAIKVASDVINKSLFGSASAWSPSANDMQALELDFDTTAAMMGMPYQFLPWVDRRAKGGDDVISNFKYLGRKYAEKIAVRSPMLIIQPGKAHYMAESSNEEKEALLSGMLGDDAAISNSSIDEETANPHRYYSFALDHASYNAYVNTLCWTCAMNLGLNVTQYEGVGNINSVAFSENRFMNRGITDNVDGVYNFSQKFTSKLKYTGAIAFYVNSDAQVSESISTSTGQSQLAEKVNGISDLAREIQFVLGTNGKIADVAASMGKTSGGALQAAVSGLSSAFTGSGSLLNSIGESIGTIIAGGKLIFPEIWQDTQFTRSYTINLKLVSPDNDDLSIYHNILVPLMHLLALALPRGTGTNSYMSPFLIRAAYKSFMNIDMGIVTGLSINRGSEGCWNRHGIPTSVDVSLDLKDLYPVMNLARYPSFASMMPFTDDGYDILKNDALLAYIANICGLNVINSDVSRALSFKAMMAKKSVTNMPNAIIDATWGKLTSVTSNWLGGWGL